MYYRFNEVPKLPTQDQLRKYVKSGTDDPALTIPIVFSK